MATNVVTCQVVRILIWTGCPTYVSSVSEVKEIVVKKLPSRLFCTLHPLFKYLYSIRSYERTIAINKSFFVNFFTLRWLEFPKRWSRVSHEFSIFISILLLYTLFAVRNEPKPVLRYPSTRTRLSTYLNANDGHFKIRFFQKDKGILEKNGSFPAANRVLSLICISSVPSSWFREVSSKNILTTGQQPAIPSLHIPNPLFYKLCQQGSEIKNKQLARAWDTEGKWSLIPLPQHQACPLDWSKSSFSQLQLGKN